MDGYVVLGLVPLALVGVLWLLTSYPVMRALIADRPAWRTFQVACVVLGLILALAPPDLRATLTLHGVLDLDGPWALTPWQVLTERLDPRLYAAPWLSAPAETLSPVIQGLLFAVGAVFVGWGAYVVMRVGAGGALRVVAFALPTAVVLVALTVCLLVIAVYTVHSLNFWSLAVAIILIQILRSWSRHPHGGGHARGVPLTLPSAGLQQGPAGRPSGGSPSSSLPSPSQLQAERTMVDKKHSEATSPSSSKSAGASASAGAGESSTTTTAATGKGAGTRTGGGASGNGGGRSQQPLVVQKPSNTTGMLGLVLGVVALLVALGYPIWTPYVYGQGGAEGPMSRNGWLTAPAVDALVEQDIAALTRRVDEVSRDQADLRELLDTARLPAVLMISTRLKQLIAANAPYDRELRLFRMVAGDGDRVGPILEALEPYAETGVPTREELAKGIDRVAYAIILAEQRPEPFYSGAAAVQMEQTVAGIAATIARMRWQLQGMPDGDDNGARVIRAERLVAEGNMAAAVEALEGLSEEVAPLAADWVEAVKGRLAVDQAAEDLEAYVIGLASRMT